MTQLDVREIPPNERHDRIHDAFADLAPGESLTIVNDHDPKPLYYELSAEVPAFDDEGYTVDREGPERFVAELPKAATDGSVETVRIDAIDGEPHAEAFPGREPKTVRLSLSAGEGVAAHDHPGRAVLFHALEGSFDVRIDDETHVVEAGELLRFDGDRTVEPTAREDATALVVLAERSEA
ncbi:DUF2249 domain-containing protein [Halorubrum laminariae]|uniref:DUF2249 domain-containing protein n=1 Tax=Halorubrum laminariae TaxID=1433523 RepID=A0ABD6C3R6_9EURY|nr:DUF2249 domain-containing protein [Halorubrum laminariae]